jgi:hypothetical protein
VSTLSRVQALSALFSFLLRNPNWLSNLHIAGDIGWLKEPYATRYARLVQQVLILRAVVLTLASLGPALAFEPLADVRNSAVRLHSRRD